MHQKYVIIMGNPVDGYQIIGPFESKGYAYDYMRTDPSKGLNMWAAPLDAPAEQDQE